MSYSSIILVMDPQEECKEPSDKFNSDEEYEVEEDLNSNFRDRRNAKKKTNKKTKDKSTKKGVQIV